MLTFIKKWRERRMREKYIKYVLKSQENTSQWTYALNVKTLAEESERLMDYIKNGNIENG